MTARRLVALSHSPGQEEAADATFDLKALTTAPAPRPVVRRRTTSSV
ncbi:hypothetical protein ACWD26_36255 [Streptomyces sp. NPDC002787]